MSVTTAVLLDRVRTQKPLVHHITNWVTIYDCAAVVKACGASPVMAHAKEEVADMASIASALVLNIGTLTTELVESMKIAALRANAKGIPVVLDVCGAGATPFRDEKCFELLKETTINIIKGNASEIARIAGEQVHTKGVDVGDVQHDMIVVAKNLAVKHNATVVVTGKEDIVTDGVKTFLVVNGHALMTHVVGTGCMATSVIATFAAVEKDLVLAAAAGLACYEVASEIAATQTKWPASFKELMLNAVYGLTADAVSSAQRVVELK